MQFIPVKTRTLVPPRDDLFFVFDESLGGLREGDILFVTSKVLAIHQGRCVPVSDVPDKDALIRAEAEAFVGRDRVPGRHAVLALKHHTLIASAGIDESNGNGQYVLWPENIDESAREIRTYLRRRRGMQNLGVVLTDSHSLPLRYGVVGISLAHAGFEPLADARGRRDLFGRPITMTLQNIPDALAAAAVLLMGESDESTPLLILRGYPAAFTEADTNAKLRVPPEQDLYKPLLDAFHKEK